MTIDDARLLKRGWYWAVHKDGGPRSKIFVNPTPDGFPRFVATHWTGAPILRKSFVREWEQIESVSLIREQP